MTYTKLTIADDKVEVLSLGEVAERLDWSGALMLGNDERRGAVRLECGCDLEIDIHRRDELDPRVDGHLERTMTFSLTDLEREFMGSDLVCWAKNDDGEDVLACFGC